MPVVVLAVGEPACIAGGLGSIPGLGRSPGEGKGFPLQYSGLENSLDCIVHGVTELDTAERLALSFEIPAREPGAAMALARDAGWDRLGVGAVPQEGGDQAVGSSLSACPWGSP